MMTLDEVIIASLARAVDYELRVPSAHSVMYRRVSIRQQELFSRAAKINPDWAGVSAVGPLVVWAGGLAMDVSDLIDPSEGADLITRVEIADKGTSAYVNGQEVNIVQLADPNIADPPRVTVRRRIVQAVGADLVNVTSIRVFYSAIPLPMDTKDCLVDVPDPHSELLVLDLVKWLAKKTLTLDAGVKTALITSLDDEEKEALANFDAYVARFSDATISRFGGSRYAPGRTA